MASCLLRRPGVTTGRRSGTRTQCSSASWPSPPGSCLMRSSQVRLTWLCFNLNIHFLRNFQVPSQHWRLLRLPSPSSQWPKHPAECWRLLQGSGVNWDQQRRGDPQLWWLYQKVGWQSGSQFPCNLFIFASSSLLREEFSDVSYWDEVRGPFYIFDRWIFALF